MAAEPDELLDKDAFDIIENDSLEDIKARLEKRIDDIDEASAKFFNQNYGQFFQFASLVAELEQPIGQTIQPLLLLRDSLQALLNKLDTKLSEIDKKLDYLSTIATEKSIASRLMKLAERRDSLVLSRTRTCPSPMLKSLQCDLLERTNAELFYLLQKLNAGRHVEDLVQQISMSLSVELRQ